MANEGFTTATDFADFLVRTKKLTFREAYTVSSRLVNYAEKNKVRLDELTLKEINKFLKNINIDDIKVFKPEGHSTKIALTDEMGIVMRYPGMQRFVELDFLQKELNAEEVFELIAESIDQIYDGEEVYDSTTTTLKEFRTFVDGLTTKQFESIRQFYQTSPKLSHTFTVVNPNTGVDSEYTIEGLQSFFA